MPHGPELCDRRMTTFYHTHSGDSVLSSDSNKYPAWQPEDTKCNFALRSFIEAAMGDDLRNGNSALHVRSLKGKYPGEQQIVNQMGQISIEDVLRTPVITLTDADGGCKSGGDGSVADNGSGTNGLLTVPSPDLSDEPMRPPMK